MFKSLQEQLKALNNKIQKTLKGLIMFMNCFQMTSSRL